MFWIFLELEIGARSGPYLLVGIIGRFIPSFASKTFKQNIKVHLKSTVCEIFSNATLVTVNRINSEINPVEFHLVSWAIGQLGNLAIPACNSQWPPNKHLGNV